MYFLIYNILGNVSLYRDPGQFNKIPNSLTISNFILHGIVLLLFLK